MDVHPGGDNLIIGSYDKKLAWFDMDLSAKPYKTLRRVYSKCYLCSNADRKTTDTTTVLFDPLLITLLSPSSPPPQMTAQSTSSIAPFTPTSCKTLSSFL